MSNYPAGVNDDDPAFNLPSVGDGEGCCSNPDCESWRDGYDGELCYSCQVTEGADLAYWERVFASEPPPATEDDLEAYSEPCERGKREGLRRMIGGE